MTTLQFGKYKGKAIGVIPDTHLDWLLGEDWFVKQSRNSLLIQEIEKELAIRKRSDGYIEDEFGKTLEDI